MAARNKKSKKQSATRSGPLEDVTFFIDASLGRKIVAEALRRAGAKVEVHDDHFPQGTPDKEWLAAAGQRCWAVLTKDDRIRYHDLERLALTNARVRAFVLTARGLRGEENAGILVNALPAIHRMLSKRPGPFIAKISRGGAVSLLIRGN